MYYGDFFCSAQVKMAGGSQVEMSASGDPWRVQGERAARPSTHQQAFHRWLERAWRGGLRLAEARRFQTFIDTQRGGPGLGWLRIVESPAEARRVIRQGKLAVVLGIEVDNPFGCMQGGARDQRSGNTSRASTPVTVRED